VLWPLYRGVRPDGARTYATFTFKTSLAPGKTDVDRRVLKLDYALPENPRFSIRRVLDEVVQLPDGTFLGKAYLRWWWERWQLVAFFRLSATRAAPSEPGER